MEICIRGNCATKNVSTFTSEENDVAAVRRTSVEALVLHVVIVALLLVLVFWKPKKQRQELPGNVGWPLIGETIDFIRKNADGEFFREREQRFGRVFRTHVLGSPTVYISGREAVRSVLYGEGRLVEAAWPPAMKYLLGPHGISSAVYHCHKQQKRQVLRAMDSDMLRDSVDILQVIQAEELERWSGKSQTDVWKSAKAMTTRLACIFLFGSEVKNTDAVCRLLGDIADGFFSLPVPLPGFAFYKALNARAEMERCISSMLDDFQRGNCPPIDFVPVVWSMMQSSQTSDPGQFMDLACELLIGGQETVTSAITSLVMALHMHPHVVTKIKAELSDYDLLDPTAPVSYEILGKLEYVENVIKETLRCYPPIGGGYKKVIKPFSVNGFQIDVGWKVIYSISSTQGESGDGRYERAGFCPENWSAGQASADPARAYMPFAAGPRSCVGKAYARTVLRLFLVQLVRLTNWTVAEPFPSTVCVPTLRPKTKMLATFNANQTS